MRPTGGLSLSFPSHRDRVTSNRAAGKMTKISRIFTLAFDCDQTKSGKQHFRLSLTMPKGISQTGALTPYRRTVVKNEPGVNVTIDKVDVGNSLEICKVLRLEGMADTS